MLYCTYTEISKCQTVFYFYSAFSELNGNVEAVRHIATEIRENVETVRQITSRTCGDVEAIRHQLNEVELTLQAEARRKEKDRPHNREEGQENQGIVNLAMLIVEVPPRIHTFLCNLKFSGYL